MIIDAIQQHVIMVTNYNTIIIAEVQDGESMINPGYEFIFSAEGQLAKPIQFGETFEGARRMIPILEGNFEGPNIRGTFLPTAAADWQYTRADGVTQAEAIYAIQTDDNVIIQVENYGLRFGTDEVMTRLAAGEDVDPGEYYFRTNPRFKAPEGKYDWLNKGIFIGTGARYANSIKLWFFKVT